MDDILKQIDEEDNIYYNIIKNEYELIDIINKLLDISVMSLFIIEISRENILDKFFDIIKANDLVSKHRYIFINKNLGKLHKINMYIKSYEDLKHVKNTLYSIDNNNVKLNDKVYPYIITLN